MKTAQELIDLIARQYAAQPDDYVVSVGHWKQEWPHPVPHFYADIKLTAGELRTLASQTAE